MHNSPSSRDVIVITPGVNLVPHFFLNIEIYGILSCERRWSQFGISLFLYYH